MTADPPLTSTLSPGLEDSVTPNNEDLIAVAASLPVLGAAPDWDNDTWINTETPLPLEELRGKVVLLEFWTFG